MIDGGERKRREANGCEPLSGKLPRVRVNANGRTLRIQRKVASSEKTANLTAEAKYDGASRGIHAAHFPIPVPSKVLSGTSEKTELRECAAQFLPRCGTLLVKGRRREGWKVYGTV